MEDGMIKDPSIMFQGLSNEIILSITYITRINHVIYTMKYNRTILEGNVLIIEAKRQTF